MCQIHTPPHTQAHTRSHRAFIIFQQSGNSEGSLAAECGATLSILPHRTDYRSECFAVQTSTCARTYFRLISAINLYLPSNIHTTACYPSRGASVVRHPLSNEVRARGSEHGRPRPARSQVSYLQLLTMWRRSTVITLELILNWCKVSFVLSSVEHIIDLSWSQRSQSYVAEAVYAEGDQVSI